MYTAARGLSALGVDVQRARLGNLRNPATKIGARRRVRDLARTADGVHTQFGSACALATRGCGAPAVVSIRGNDWNVHSETLHPLWIHTRFARVMSRAALGGFCVAVCVSRRIADEVAREVGPGTDVVVLPSPIDLNVWPECTGPRRSGRPPHRVLFTACNPNDPIKRVRLLEAALAIAESRIGPIELVRATDIDHAAMPALVSSCDAVACTSETEGWPNFVKEALACGVSFVDTDVSDLRSIADAELSCRIADASPESIAEALCAVLSVERVPNLRRHVEPMGLEAVSRRLLSIYESVAGR